MNYSLAAVILAAGASSRMGQPKMVLPWGQTSVIGHIIAEWSSLAGQLRVVIPPMESAVKAELVRLGIPMSQWIVNAAPEQGMFSSIQYAARADGWNADATHWAIALGDQPQITSSILTRLRDFSLTHPEAICQPSRNNRPKHPVLLPKSAFKELAVTPASTLRDFIAQSWSPRLCLEVDDSSVDFDLDTPEDYSLALKRLSG